MPTATPLDPRLTEQRNPASADIDLAAPGEIIDLMLAQDELVIEAVRSQKDRIAAAIEMVERCFRGGGHLYYVGAGTSGRLGMLDASECPPTFGVDRSLVQGMMAGGDEALFKSMEGAEDDEEAGAVAIDEKEAGPKDVVFGIATSGGTPFVKGAITRARARGAKTIFFACTDLPAEVLANTDIAIIPKVGPEILTGSTRLKAGTATKLVLNMVTTGAMIRWGRTYGNFMVDLKAVANKLRDRGERIVMEICGVTRSEARALIDAAGMHVKTAIVMKKKNVGRAEAERLLEQAGGYARKAIGEPPPPVMAR